MSFMRSEAMRVAYLYVCISDSDELLSNYNIKFGGGTYVINLKKIGIGLLISTLAVGASVLSQLYINTYAANTLPGNNEVITIGGTTDGQPVNASVSPIAYSGDGNIILFTSNATNLPNAGAPGGLYIYNIETNTTARVDISTSGVLPNGGLFGGAAGSGIRMSETGRYVTFSSMATNLIDGATKSPQMIYKRDTQANATTVVGAGYTQGYSDKWDRNLAVSNDGRFVLVSSRYLANNYPYNYIIAVGDGNTGTYTWTVAGSGSPNDTAGAGEMSCDGMFAAMTYGGQIALADLRKGSTTILATSAYDSASPLISCNGRYVLYTTKNRTQITPTPAGMNTYQHLVRYDRLTGERIYIDSDSSNVFSAAQYTYSPVYYDVQPNIFNVSIADTGDVVFDYKQGINTYRYLKHLSDGSGTLESIAKTASGTYININNGTMTSDGRYIFFKTDPYNLGLAPSPSSDQIIRTKTGL